MSDEIDVPEGGGDEGGGSDSVRDVLADFGKEEDTPERKEPEEKPEPKRETKPEPKDDKPKAEAKPEKKEEAKEPPKPKPRHKVKVDGEELEVDEDELLRGYQRAASVTKRAQALAQERKAIEEARALALKDPAAALKSLGLDPAKFDEMAEKRVYERFAREFGPDGQPLSPEQRELARLRAEAAQREQEKQAETERIQREEEQKAQAEQERHWVKTIVARLEAKGEDKFLLPRVAQHLQAAIEADQGLNPADLLDDAIDLAREDVVAEHAQAFGAMDYGQIKTRYPDLVEKIRKGIVADFKASRAQAKPQEVEVPEEKRRERALPVPRTSRDALRSFVHG